MFVVCWSPFLLFLVGLTNKEAIVINLPLWQEYIEKKSGFVLPTTQQNWLIYAVEATAKSLGMSVEDLYEKVGSDKTVEQILFDKLLISESRFFRHKDSLDFVAEQYNAQLMMHNKPNAKQQFRVWSAGCSAGQEVYSVAMGLQTVQEEHRSLPPYIVTGSDMSKKSLNRAQLAQYGSRDIQSVPEEYRRYLHEIEPEHADDLLAFSHQKCWQVDKHITQQTQFFWQNLFLKTATKLPKQDVIVCQNVLIYFRKFDQRDILGYFVHNLAVGGHLMLAPNEVMFWQHPKMQRVEHESINAWQKIAE